MDRLNSLLEEIFDGRFRQAVEAESFPEVEGWDSLVYVRLVVAVQDEFDVQLTAEEIERLLSYEGLKAVLAGRGVDA
jgi:acyl carrier protein